jgi:hypothetical protein
MLNIENLWKTFEEKYHKKILMSPYLEVCDVSNGTQRIIREPGGAAPNAGQAPVS